MGTRGSIGEVSYRGASWGAITLTKQVAKNNCQRTSIGCRLIRWHICPDPSSAGWERVKKSWGAVAQTPIRATKETSANPSKLGLQRFAGRNKQQNKLVVNSERFLLDGEFNSPPSPPETRMSPEEFRGYPILEISANCNVSERKLIWLLYVDNNLETSLL